MSRKMQRFARMFRSPDDGPASSFHRYAYGWSNEKPSASFWCIIGAMLAFVIWKFYTLT